jgi:hypothetical protein
MKHIAASDEFLWVYSMGKRFRVRAMTTDEDLSNAYMEKHRDTGLIACFGPFQIIANLYDGVTDNRPEKERNHT